MKLAGLGRLTAGIAHEIRNPLGSISHAAQLLQESEELDASDRRLTQIIQDQSKRMNLVIESVLQLSPSPPGQTAAARPEGVGFSGSSTNTPAGCATTANCTCSSVPATSRPAWTHISSNQVLSNLVQNGLRYSAQARWARPGLAEPRAPTRRATCRCWKSSTTVPAYRRTN